MGKALTRTGATRGELLAAIADLADKLAPAAGERGTSFGGLAAKAPVATSR
jgi:hypothetical protein